MKRGRKPVILVVPGHQAKGVEFGDHSISLSGRYLEAVEAGGGVPLILPLLASHELVETAIAHVDGVLLTGGADVNPALYTKKVSVSLRKTLSELDPQRDLVELFVISATFRKRKPLLAICRGHQILNVAMGGTLLIDIPSQVPKEVGHKRYDRKDKIVHDTEVQKGSLLHSIVKTTRLGVNSSHHQAVEKLAPCFKPTAWSSDGINEAFELKPVAPMLPFLLAVQYHPERLFTEHVEHLRLFEAFGAACAGKR